MQPLLEQMNRDFYEEDSPRAMILYVFWINHPFG